MVTQDSAFHKCTMNTAHQIELFVIPDFQETEGRNLGGVGGRWEGERILHTTKSILDGFS